MTLAWVKHQLMKQGVKYCTANSLRKLSVHNGNKSLTKGLGGEKLEAVTTHLCSKCDFHFWVFHLTDEDKSLAK